MVLNLIQIQVDSALWKITWFYTYHFHFYALEKEMATHSSVLAWRIPGMGESGGLPSTGSHRVRHDWSDLATPQHPQHHPRQTPLMMWTEAAANKPGPPQTRRGLERSQSLKPSSSPRWYPKPEKKHRTHHDCPEPWNQANAQAWIFSACPVSGDKEGTDDSGFGSRVHQLNE